MEKGEKITKVHNDSDIKESLVSVLTTTVASIYAAYRKRGSEPPFKRRKKQMNVIYDSFSADRAQAIFF